MLENSILRLTRGRFGNIYKLRDTRSNFDFDRLMSTRILPLFGFFVPVVLVRLFLLFLFLSLEIHVPHVALTSNLFCFAGAWVG